MLYIAGPVKNKMYRFIHCTFSQNQANSNTYNFILSSPNEGTSLRQRGRGGGMRVTIVADVEQVEVIILNSTFEGNHAFLGAGLSAAISGGGRSSNVVIVKDTTFTSNGCRTKNESHTKIESIAGIGGGIYLSFEHLSGNRPTRHSIEIVNVTFRSNCAELGGGSYFFSSRSQTPEIMNKIRFVNCTWTHNYAHTGSAVDISPNVFTRVQSGYLPTPVFENCSFVSNTVRDIHENGQSYGSGTLYSSLINIKFEHFVLFEKNFGSGIVIVNGEADFVAASANFTENHGIQGGAVLLIGASSMIVGARKKYRFLKNRANDRGGAIYSYLVDNTDFVVSRSCFIQYRDNTMQNENLIVPSRNWSTSLIFENNTALRSGHSIYATSIIPCQVVYEGNRIYRVLNHDDIFVPPGFIIRPENDSKQITTEGSRFDSISCTQLQVIPGATTSLGVKILDDFGTNVSTTLTAYIQGNNNISIDSEFSCITDHNIKLNGPIGDTGNLVLQTIGSRKLSLTIPIKILPCPPGHQLKEKACVCTSEEYVGIETCREYRAYMTEGFWAGYINISGTTEFATSLCPVGFCTYNDSTNIKMGTVVLPKNSSELEEAVCGRNRRGVLCGVCQAGFTTHYHSSQFRCLEASIHSCRFGWAFYILSELVPVTLLFLFVLVLNISLTTGAVNGFILFSQLLDTLLTDASGVITFPGPITALRRGYQLIYGFFSLDLFTIDPLSFCIWRDANALDMLSFKYLTVGYSLLLVLSVILFMKYSAARCLGRYYSITLLRNSIIHGLSGFLVLTYGQCIKISFSILKSQEVRHRATYSNSNSNSNSLNRVFLNGEIVFFSHDHLSYAVPALVILLLIGVLPPLLLIGYPLLNKVFIVLKLEKSCLVRRLNHMSKLKPLLDSFQGSFRDNLRFFAGIYFFYRWTTVITYAIVSQLSIFYTIAEAFLIVMLLVHSISQPYQKRWHNILDTLLFCNLAIINGLTALNYYWIRVDGGRKNEKVYSWITLTGSFQLVLIYLPLLYIVVYAIARLLERTCQKVAKEEPAKEDFVLKKIRKRLHHVSFSGSEASNTLNDSLPYRLIDKELDSPFEASDSFNEGNIDTYL